MRDGHADVLEQGGITGDFALPFSSQKLAELTWAHRQDTMFLFHEDVKTSRVIATDNGWQVDHLPYEDIPNYDYGAVYTNGEPAEWEINFVGFDAGKRFRLTISGGQETVSIYYNATGEID